jgi:hypothetical protein
MIPVQPRQEAISFFQNNQSTVAWRCRSGGRVPTSEVEGLSSTPIAPEKKKRIGGLGYSSMIEHIFSMNETLGLMPRGKKNGYSGL